MLSRGKLLLVVKLMIGLVESIFQANLHFPALVVVVVEVPRLGGIFAVALHHAEYGCVVLNLVEFENLSVVADAHVLGYTPLRIEEVAYVHDVYAEL